MMDLYGNGLLLGEKTLDSLWMRQNLTMNNIANVDTPGFKSQYMTFENELAQKIRSALTHDKRMNDCLPPILFSAIFKLLKVLPDTELDAC